MKHDLIVTTEDGRKHRVIYESNGKLLVKCAEGKSKPAYKICATKVIKREAQAQAR